MYRLFLFFVIFLASPYPKAFCKDILRRGNFVEPQSLDSQKTTGLFEANIIGDMFIGLVSRGAEGNVIEGVAKSWDISEDGLRYTFHLRDSQWSNGDNLTAHDFVYSFRRLVDPSTASPYSFLAEGIVNAIDVIGGTETDISSLGVEAIDDYTLQIRLVVPIPYFINILTMEQFCPLHVSTVESNDNTWTRPENIVSNGPFILKEWNVNEKIVLEKNENFYDSDSVSLDGVEFFPIADDVEWKKYQSDDLDITLSIPIEHIESAKNNMFDEIYKDSLLSCVRLVFNMDKFIGDYDVNLRRALSLAINRGVLCEKVLRGSGEESFHIVPSGISGYFPPNFDFELMSQATREELAKTYMEKVSINPSDVNIEILYALTENNKKLVVAIAGMWKQVLGINVTLRGEEWKVFLSQMYSQNFQVVMRRWLADFDDAHDFFYHMYSNTRANVGRYCSRDCDQFIDQANKSLDPQERSLMFEKAERIALEDDVCMIPLYQQIALGLKKPNVEGFYDSPLQRHPSRFIKLKR